MVVSKSPLLCSRVDHAMGDAELSGHSFLCAHGMGCAELRGRSFLCAHGMGCAELRGRSFLCAHGIRPWESALLRFPCGPRHGRCRTPWPEFPVRAWHGLCRTPWPEFPVCAWHAAKATSAAPIFRQSDLRNQISLPLAQDRQQMPPSYDDLQCLRWGRGAGDDNIWQRRTTTANVFAWSSSYHSLDNCPDLSLSKSLKLRKQV